MIPKVSVRLPYKLVIPMTEGKWESTARVLLHCVQVALNRSITV